MTLLSLIVSFGIENKVLFDRRLKNQLDWHTWNEILWLIHQTPGPE